MTKENLAEIFDEIILGKNVKRSFHNLSLNDIDYTDIFIQRLKYFNFEETTVGQIIVSPGFRIPGFLLRNSYAIFGYIFWELFNLQQKRKLWGSVISNKKGDWKYTVSEKSKNKIWVNKSLVEEIYLSTFGL